MKLELVTNLKRKATKILAELNKEKIPILITEHGKPSAYLLDVESYEAMQRKMTILEGIARGEKALQDNDTLSHTQAKKRLKKWLK